MGLDPAYGPANSHTALGTDPSAARSGRADEHEFM